MKISSLVRKNGARIFHKKKRHNIFDPSTYENATTLPHDYEDKFTDNLYTDISENDIKRIFIFSEYLKRKFFIDCKMATEKFIKKLQSSEDIVQITPLTLFLDILSIDENEEICLRMNKDKIFDILSPVEDVYLHFKSVFYSLFDKFRDIMLSPDLYKRYLDEDAINFIKNYSQRHQIDIYLFERIIYSCLDWLPRPSYAPNNLGKLVNIFSNPLFWTLFSHNFMVIHRKIVDKYSLYLNELYKISAIDVYIKNDYKIDVLPRYFLLPKEPQRNGLFDEMVNFDFNPKTDNIHIDITLNHNVDSTSLSRYISGILLQGLYFYKEETGKGYTYDEIKYFVEFIELKNKQNYSKNKRRKNTNNQERLINLRFVALYLWDKCYLSYYNQFSSDKNINEQHNTSSININFSQEIKDYFYKFNNIPLHLGKRTNENKKDKNTERNYTSYIKTTMESIETGQFLPFKRNNSKK